MGMIAERLFGNDPFQLDDGPAIRSVTELPQLRVPLGCDAPSVSHLKIGSCGIFFCWSVTRKKAAEF